MGYDLSLPIKNDYYTHLPLMKYLFENVITSGSKVLELGCGEGSSPFLKYVQEQLDLDVYSFETDAGWFNNIKNKYGSEKYKFSHIENWDEFGCHLFNDSDFFDLVFIDQSPWEARIEAALKLKDRSNYVVIHDYDYYIRKLNHLHKQIEENFKFIKYYDNIHPETILLSNFKDVEFDNIQWI